MHALQQIVSIKLNICWLFEMTFFLIFIIFDVLKRANGNKEKSIYREFNQD